MDTFPLSDMHANAVELKGEKAQSSAPDPMLITTKASLRFSGLKLLNCRQHGKFSEIMKDCKNGYLCIPFSTIPNFDEPISAAGQKDVRMERVPFN